jgi:hypothetical protein
MQPVTPDLRRDPHPASSWTFLGIAVVLGAVVAVGVAAVVVVAVHAGGLLPLLALVSVLVVALVARNLRLARQRRLAERTPGEADLGWTELTAP